MPQNCVGHKGIFIAIGIYTIRYYNTALEFELFNMIPANQKTKLDGQTKPFPSQDISIHLCRNFTTLLSIYGVLYQTIKSFKIEFFFLRQELFYLIVNLKEEFIKIEFCKQLTILLNGR